MKKIYYAHGLYLYDTEQEERDIGTLHDLGFEVENPNQPKHQENYDKMGGMAYFEEVVRACDALAFRAYPDLNIGAGCYKEIVWAMRDNKPIIELPSVIFRRKLSIDETREYLHELGQR